MSKARQSTRQRHNWTRIDMSAGGRIGFSDVGGGVSEREQEERNKNILQTLFGGLRKGFTNEAGRLRRQNRRAERTASGDWYLGKRLADRRASRQANNQWYLGKKLGADPAKRQGIAPKSWSHTMIDASARNREAREAAARGETGGQPVRRWFKDNLLNKPWMPGGTQGPLREMGESFGWDGERLRNRPNYDRVMNVARYFNPFSEKGIIRGPLGGWRTGENTGGRVNARTGLYNTGRGRELDAVMPKQRQMLIGKTSTEKQKPTPAPRPAQTLIEGPIKKNTAPPNYVADGDQIPRQFQQTQAPSDDDVHLRNDLANLNRVQREAVERGGGEDLGRVEPTTSGGRQAQSANIPAAQRAQLQAQSATFSGQETYEGADEGETVAKQTFTTGTGEEVEFWDGVSKPTRAMFPKGEQGDMAYAAALGTWGSNNPDGGNGSSGGGDGDASVDVMPRPTDPQQQLQDQASTNPKLENIDAVKTDATILTGDEKIQKITDPTNVEPATAVEATDLTAKTGTAEEGELTDAEDTVTYDAVDAEAVDPTQAQTGTVDKDAVAGQATMTERAVAAKRDAEQEAAAKAKEQDYKISDDAFVSDVTFREGVVVTDTDPAEQQQRQVQLGMPAPDGEAAQIINKYGFGNSKKPPRIVTGAKAKQQAAAQLAADHDLDPEVANQIMEDVEGFDVEGQSQESLGAVAALPKEALVSTQIENLVAGMEDGKPPVWARPAVAAVEQMMAARGLSASTVGRDALFNSIIQSAMPIAQSNATALQQRAAQNLSNEQQALIQDREIAARFLEKNAEFRQQMNIANLSNDQQMRLANLTSRNQNESENLSARQQTELANLNARLQTNLTSAKIAESMGVAQLNVDQQRAMQNAGMVANVDMNKFNAAQQIELANSKFMQTMTMKDLDNRQQTALQNATLQTQVDMANASERTKASVANAQNYLQMNLTNVNNRQQATITDQQLKQQRLLSDQAAENAARQFNAKSENQNNQFMVNMANQMEQFNKAQVNTMEQFNIGEQNRMAATEADQKLRADSFNAEQVNRIRQFDAELDFRADSWNAQNAQAIQQSNIEWRRKCNTIDTAAQNAVNATNAQMQFGMTQQAQSALWQQLRDAAHFSHQDSQSAWDRKMNIANAAMGNETLMTHRDFQKEQKQIWDLIDSIMSDTSPPGSIAPMDSNDQGPPDDEVA